MVDLKKNLQTKKNKFPVRIICWDRVGHTLHGLSVPIMALYHHPQYKADYPISLTIDGIAPGCPDFDVENVPTEEIRYGLKIHGRLGFNFGSTPEILRYNLGPYDEKDLVKVRIIEIVD